MPSLDEMLAGKEAASDSSSPEGQRRIHSEILSLQQEARLKKQQLAEVAASVQQKRDDVDLLRADDRALHRRHVQSMKSLVRSKEDLSRRERLKNATSLHRATLGLDESPSPPPVSHRQQQQQQHSHRDTRQQPRQQHQSVDADMFLTPRQPLSHSEPPITGDFPPHQYSSMPPPQPPQQPPPQYPHVYGQQNPAQRHHSSSLHYQQPHAPPQYYNQNPRLPPQQQQQQHYPQQPLQGSSSMPNVSSVTSAPAAVAAAELAQQLQTHHTIMTETILAKRNELSRIEDEVEEAQKTLRATKKQLAESQTSSDSAAAHLSATQKSLVEESSRLELMVDRLKSTEAALAAKTQALTATASDEAERNRILQRIVDLTRKKDEEFRKLVDGIAEAEERKKDVDEEVEEAVRRESELMASLTSKQRQLEDTSAQLDKLLTETENGRAELKSLDQALGAQRTALAVANRAADKRKEETKALNREAEELVKVKNNELEEKRLELEALASEKEEASTEVSRLKREWAALKKRSEEEVDAVERLKNAKNKAEGELQSIKRQVEEAKRELGSTVEEMESRTSALAELKSTIAVNDDVYAKLVNLRKDAENDVESLSDMLKGLKHDVDVMTSEKNAVETQVRELFKQKKIYETEIAQIQAAADEAKQHRDTATQQVHVTHGRVERLKNEIDSLEREIQAAKEERKEIEKQKTKEAKEMEELKDEILFLKDEIQSGQEETQRVCDELKSLRSTREETLLEIRREEERLNLAKKRREEEEEETKRAEEEGGAKAEERMMVEKELEAALQKLVRTRKEIESEERRKEEIVEDKRRHVEHLDHRLAERAKEMADVEAEMRAAQEEAAKRKASTAELTRLEEEVEKWKRKVEEKEGEREAVIVEKDSLMSSVAAVTEELALVRLSVAEENDDRERAARNMEKELQEVKDAHHHAVSALSSKLNSAIESRRNAEAKAEAHLIEATRLAEEVAAVREELIKAKKDLVAKKTKERKEKRVSRALGELQQDVLNTLENQVDHNGPRITRRRDHGGDDDGGAGNGGGNDFRRWNLGAASRKFDGDDYGGGDSVRGGGRGGRAGAGNTEGARTEDARDEGADGNLAKVEMVRSPNVTNGSTFVRSLDQAVDQPQPETADISDAENDDSLAQQIDLLRENMAAARRTLPNVDVDGQTENDVSKEKPSYVPHQPLGDLSNFTTRGAPSTLLNAPNNSSSAKPKNKLISFHHKLPSSNPPSKSFIPRYAGSNGRGVPNNADETTNGFSNAVPSLALNDDSQEPLPPSSSSHPVDVTSSIAATVTNPPTSTHPSYHRPSTSSHLPPAPPAEDPYRRYGQAQFVEAEVRLKRALRDQMASHAEKLSARMSKMSSTSLEALQRKVENLEDIMTTGSLSPVDMEGSRRSRRRFGGGGGESNYYTQNASVDHHSAAAYRPYSAPFERPDSTLTSTPHKSELYASSNQNGGSGFLPFSRRERDMGPSRPSQVPSSNQGLASSFGVSARSFDISLPLTPSSSIAPPPVVLITPPSGLRGRENGEGDGLKLGGIPAAASSASTWRDGGGEGVQERNPNRQSAFTRKHSSKQLDFETQR